MRQTSSNASPVPQYHINHTNANPLVERAPVPATAQLHERTQVDPDPDANHQSSAGSGTHEPPESQSPPEKCAGTSERHITTPGKRASSRNERSLRTAMAAAAAGSATGAPLWKKAFL